MKKRNTWIPVVAGILKKGPHVLVGQRPKDNTLAGKWEFPGGKIELGETPEQALNRELREELGIEAEIGALKLAITHTYTEIGILILFYEVRYWKGEPKPVHHMKIDWILPEALRDLEIPEANRRILPDLLKFIAEL